MSGAAIRVENLGKMYRIGGPVERYKTLRESVTRAVAGAGRRLRGLLGGGNGVNPGQETIWALKDVSFEVQPGEVVGIIGRNGAGKSTLLKILSRITEPTEGRVEIRGRVGSLLEVGTGFHPELTGRENVYLNGAILGMKRAEVDRKFDEIVAFAEVEKFIDTPVKHYSSGMYLRLAFSVASHLEPEVLLVDEVLAVGDHAFQRRCLSKIEFASTRGSVVLLVSHNLGAIRSLCKKTIVLDQGRLIAQADSNTALAVYLDKVQRQTTFKAQPLKNLHGNRRDIEVGNILVLGDQGQTGLWVTGSRGTIIFTIQNPRGEHYDVSFTIYDQLNNPITHCTTRHCKKWKTGNSSTQTLAWQCAVIPLMPGIYYLNVAINNASQQLVHLENAAQVEVIAGTAYGAVVEPNQKGCVVLDYVWSETV